jgi:hypothetical protein
MGLCRQAVLWIRIRIDFGRLVPDPDPGGLKWPSKIEKKLKNFMLCSAGCLLLRGYASPVG